MDIAAVSMNMSSAKLQMNVGIAMTKKVMEQQAVEANGLLKMMEAVPAADIGQNIDVKA